MSDNNNINVPAPEIGPYTQLTPFRFWCQKVLPLVYDESLSYYELLCKVVDYLNKTMEDVDQMISDMTDFRDTYIAFSRAVTDKVEQLETYINNYFDNLDVQDEIDHKLDEMALDGYFSDLFNTLFYNDLMTEGASVVTNWIQENLLQETGYVIDKSLTVEDAAADAKTVGDELEKYALLPEDPTIINVDFMEEVGIVNRLDLTVFSTGDDYQGRHAIIDVNPGEKYLITCYTQNSTYPGCFALAEGGTTAIVPNLIQGSNGSTHTDEEITIPENGAKLYVNANYPGVIQIKQVSPHITQEMFEKQLFGYPKTMKALYDGTNLFIKKKSEKDFKDLIIKFGDSAIGNNLFTFLGFYKQNNTGDMTDDFSTFDATYNADQTDWFAPYMVKAIENADGDHPTSVYFTGGNHRSNNTGSGAGATATQNSLTFKIDGVTPVANRVYNCAFVDIYIDNSVNGYNTSKDDGSGRNILQEKRHLHITPDKIEVEQVILPLEEILIERFYGLQIYASGSNVVFKGGNERKPFAISSGYNTGNKTTKDIEVRSSNFVFEMGIDDIDLGLFPYNFDSFGGFTSGNKAYTNLIYNNTNNFDDDEEYFYKGWYKVN